MFKSFCGKPHWALGSQASYRTDNLDRARASLPNTLPSRGIGFDNTTKHIVVDLIPAFNGGSISPNYYGFVTGGVTPVALFADNVVSAYDQNVQVHLEKHSIATNVDSRP